MPSVIDLFNIGIGPSSSHTIGPMRAAKYFLTDVCQDCINQITGLKITLYGSLAYTCHGHGTDRALLAGLFGKEPDTVDPSWVFNLCDRINESRVINLLGQHEISFCLANDLVLCLKAHDHKYTNTMEFIALKDNRELRKATLFSVGGGAVEMEGNIIHASALSQKELPYVFENMHELSLLCQKHQITIAALMRANESVIHTQQSIDTLLDTILDKMFASIEAGLATDGILPGGLKVRRRAKALYQQLLEKGRPKDYTETSTMDWLNAFAIAVNEENAACQRVVTAPTNGAAGVIPAVLYFMVSFYPNITPKIKRDFLLVAGAIGFLYKYNASISAAEVGCQGEIGVASSMAAAAMCACLGGSLQQIENAAEIAMEHHLGLTCDPVAGLVQIPCIERNAMGALKAVNACRIALMEQKANVVTLDQVIETMFQTGKDMMSIYKETSQGGLAANVPEC